MDWSEELYAAIDPADPYLHDRVHVISARYLLGSMAFGDMKPKAFAIDAGGI
ncbi:hypothetical protein [Bradyrhizobium lablabi]|uniref:hypothetical protein n=1 Tax=Bradyrhizobium lablabi TaxID=722472 RepID=UPI001BAA8033|nr:hypothetical protein [Bradyrhizobium lablabi]MBR0694459.1 hypothetical protein [Bradyrhizobium lablabi]